MTHLPQTTPMGERQILGVLVCSRENRGVSKALTRKGGNRNPASPTSSWPCLAYSHKEGREAHASSEHPRRR